MCLVQKAFFKSLKIGLTLSYRLVPVKQNLYVIHNTCHLNFEFNSKIGHFNWVWKLHMCQSDLSLSDFKVMVHDEICTLVCGCALQKKKKVYYVYVRLYLLKKVFPSIVVFIMKQSPRTWIFYAFPLCCVLSKHYFKSIFLKSNINWKLTLHATIKVF